MLIRYNMWSSVHFSIFSCFPGFSGSGSRVQVQDSGPGSRVWVQGLGPGLASRVQGPGPGSGSRF